MLKSAHFPSANLIPIFVSAVIPPSPLDQFVNGGVGRPDGAFATYCKVEFDLVKPIHPCPSFVAMYKDSAASLGTVMYPHIPLNFTPQLLDAVVGSKAA